ncbi:hypothetical protein [Kibdelosporangium phytohabitans]|uniref:hypothetical protein n=1 Tax=Kibdelosporangium phytohabitans TaxID=860235 RepID=UPI00178B9363|nr:hypothetical protein [Kibdelosporangium phytohabitans]MBE1465256.1 hypothetical protein [Kibdelosporangium phytohabitans]
MIWLNRDFRPGAELFGSERDFELYDYTPSHSQLLLRTIPSDDEETRIDVLFKPVVTQKLRGHYKGLRIRCATARERERIAGQNPRVEYRDDDVFFTLDEGAGCDYVVAMAVGWHEGPYDAGEPSYFAHGYLDDTPKWAQRALDGINGYLGNPMAAPAALAAVLRDPKDRENYRHVFVVSGATTSYGVYIRGEEAEERRRDLAATFPDETYTVRSLPISF